MSKAFFINIISHFGIRQGVGVDIDYVRLFGNLYIHRYARNVRISLLLTFFITVFV